MPIINGKPAVEPGIADRKEGRALSSALATAIESGSSGVIVVCLYRCDRDAFTREHLKLLQTLSTGIHDQVLLETAS